METRKGKRGKQEEGGKGIRAEAAWCYVRHERWVVLLLQEYAREKGEEGEEGRLTVGGAASRGTPRDGESREGS